MADYRRYNNDPLRSLSEGIGSGLSTGVEMAFKNRIEEQMRQREEERQLKTKLKMAGYTEIPTTASVGGSITSGGDGLYDDVIDLDGKKYGKPLSSYEKEKRKREAEKYDMEKQRFDYDKQGMDMFKGYLPRNPALGQESQPSVNDPNSVVRDGEFARPSGAPSGTKLTIKGPGGASMTMPLGKDESSNVDALKAATTLRQEFNSLPETKSFSVLTDQHNKMNVAWERAQKLGNNESKNAVDQTLINVFNKINDPNSVVRESEFARTPEGMSMLNYFAGKLEKLKQGGVGLVDEERKQLVEMANDIYISTKDAFNKNTVSYYTEAARKYGADPSLVVGRLADKPKIVYIQGQPYEIRSDGWAYPVNGGQ